MERWSGRRLFLCIEYQSRGGRRSREYRASPRLFCLKTRDKSAERYTCTAQSCLCIEPNQIRLQTSQRAKPHLQCTRGPRF
ncbi:hypothetical protein PISMIDRAFT_673204 [Pisolithus microcarpus 441]|uniref:Uncharacterized protein n=1 Tax=Pisolithus microcarpus 441 TaxID=765257 RepID=A0A0C9ZI82_9AGAM|nr:hypothetical protein PISMIDRAFT_673204 [Pisolithus microcarpus 441]